MAPSSDSSLKFLPTERFVEAVRLAGALHGQQTKKTGAPFLSHLLEVCALVLQAGGDEDQAIAALLHDGPEKSGGRRTLAEIEGLFGGRVAKMVADCTDSFAGEEKPGWSMLKQEQVERFRNEALAESCLVYAADKLSNGREIERRLRAEGPQIWAEYGGGREGHLWYFRAMYDVFDERGAPNSLMPQLEECLRALEGGGAVMSAAPASF